MPNKFKNEEGVDCQVYVTRSSAAPAASVAEAAEDSQATTPTDQEWKAVEFTCSCCKYGYINGLSKSIQATKDYLRNHNKWCADHHDGLMKLLPKSLIPAEAEFIDWADHPTNKTRQSRNRKSKEQGGVAATEDAMLEDSGLLDDEGER